jgi:GT2 family glycosyltransferase
MSLQPLHILIIVVSYRNNRQLLEFLAQPSLRPTAPTKSSFSIVAVANGLSAPEQVALQDGLAAQTVHLPLRLCASAANPGYFGGAAQAFAQYLADNPLPEWTIVTNDDIFFADDFFPTLVTLSTPLDTGVLAPDTLVPTTQIRQNPYLRQRPGRWRLKTLLFLFRHPTAYRLYLALRRWFPRRASSHVPPVSSAGEIYAPHGACIVFNARYFTAGGTLNHFSFLYAEENFVAESCRRAGLRVRYEPSLRVEHHEHSAMRKVPSEVHLQYMRDATTALLDRYYRSTRKQLS